MRVAVTGIGVVSALGVGAERTLEAIASRRSGVGEITLFHTSHRVPAGEVKLSDRDLKELLGLPLDAAISRTALLGMVAARQALDDCVRRGGGERLRVGLISGTSVGGMDLTEKFFPQFMADDSKGRLREVAGHACGDSTKKIAEYCGISGYVTTISTACSSAANAIMLGAELIRRGVLDRVVAGGADALCKFTLNGFKSLMILDSEPCRPFDRTRAGLNLGEGAGYLVLEREDGTSGEPYCCLTGYANANDAFHQTASSEAGDGAYMAMTQALAMSGLDAGDIDYINAHGTGTPNNDASECAAFRRVFGEGIPRFSSTKPFTGHTLAAAGGVEAVLSALSVSRGIVYPGLNFGEPMEDAGYIPEAEYSEGNRINNVLSNSFGFGGNNTTLIFSAR